MTSSGAPSSRIMTGDLNCFAALAVKSFEGADVMAASSGGTVSHCVVSTLRLACGGTA